MIGSSAPDLRMPKLAAIGVLTTFVTAERTNAGTASARLNAPTSGVIDANIVAPIANVLRQRVR